MFNCHLIQKAGNYSPLRINGFGAKHPCDRRRHIRPADDGCSIHAFVEIRSPKNTGHSMSVVEALGVMQLSAAVDFIITSELRPKHDSGVAAKVGMLRLRLCRRE